MDNASARNMWGDFLDAHLEFAFEEAPKVFHFSDNEQDADQVVNLVIKNLKKAASFSLLGLQYRKEPLPKIGAFMIITDWNGKAKCIIRTKSVKLKPFFSISTDYVQLEGLGDKSLEHWKKYHWNYFTRELAPYERVPRDSMIVVCVEFDKVYG
ncbi:ASCH domain-containing protein [Arenibacter sp. N53]|uniref:ASCH domain-containing protein n=1 Tax=Arenibacter TaxID=178469 RepID=UPI000CD4463C|nr:MULTISPECIES: ASCH domain-containing protein [Arenibacter]MCM4150077.1 ASCH domain-containing protein [Arenibacter sp. N53]